MQLCRHGVLQSCILELLLKSARGLRSSHMSSVIIKLHGAISTYKYPLHRCPGKYSMSIFTTIDLCRAGLARKCLRVTPTTSCKWSSTLRTPTPLPVHHWTGLLRCDQSSSCSMQPCITITAMLATMLHQCSVASK